jgi:hypothetical protein
MFDRVEVNIVHMPSEIPLIFDAVLPEAALPQSGFFALLPGSGQAVWIKIPMPDFTTNAGFDLQPALRKVVIVLWKSPDAVKVIGQKHLESLEAVHTGSSIRILWC